MNFESPDCSWLYWLPRKMSERNSKLPDTAALVTVLGHFSELCRRLGLPNDAAVFDSFITRFHSEPPTYDTLQDEVYHVMSGVTALRILSKSKDHSEYRRLKLAFDEVAFPGFREEYEKIEKRNKERKKERRSRKAIRDSESAWHLEGESDLYAITIPDPPRSGVAATVRLTLSNPDGLLDGIDVFVRVGDPAEPTDQDDFDSATDWIQTRLVEELVFVGDEEMLRSEAEEPLKDVTNWNGTYEAQLVLPAGRHSIEVKILSRRPELLHSMVLTGWEVSAS